MNIYTAILLLLLLRFFNLCGVIQVLFRSIELGMCKKYNRLINSVSFTNQYFCSPVVQYRSALTASPLFHNAFPRTTQNKAHLSPCAQLCKMRMKDAEALAALEIKVLATREADDLTAQANMTRFPASVAAAAVLYQSLSNCSPASRCLISFDNKH